MSTITANPLALEHPEVPTSSSETTALSSTVDDDTYMMNSFSGLLEGDLYDDELNEISTLFAPAVSDDEMSKSSSSPSPSVDYDENHPGAQVAVAAAAIDSALQAVEMETEMAPAPVSSAATTNKRTHDEAMPSLAPAVQHKRRVTLDGAKRITLSSSCGSLPSLSNKTPAPAPASPKSVVAAPHVVPSSPVVKEEEIKKSAPKAAKTAGKEKTKKTTKKSSKAPTTNITIRQGMSPEEKAKACRERNRQHARMTRLRKKAYVDELKQSLNEMVEQRDADKALEEQKAKIMEQNRDVRFQVMQDFLNLRGNNEQSPQRWSTILVPEEFSLKLPVTDFQTMVQPTEGCGQQVLTSVEDVMADANFFSAFLQTLVNTNDEAASPVFFVYKCDRETFMMDGCQAMFNFEGTSCGGPSELMSSGTFRATFCPDTNRIRSAQFMFDTGSIRFQVQKMQQQAASN